MLHAQHGRHGVQHNWVHRVNHSEVQDGQQTLTHVYWTKSCNQARRLQHLRWRLKGMHDLSKLRKRAKVLIWRQKTQLVIMTYVWSWLRGWTPSCKKKLWKTPASYETPLYFRDNSLKLKCSREKRPNILLWCKGN